MKVENINISDAVNTAEALLEKENLSPAFKVTFKLLLTIVTLLANSLNLNSSNSSIPPSSDPNRKKKKKENSNKSGKKPGGQNGHKGATLEKVNDPNLVEVIEIDKRTLPRGKQFKEAGYESRQVFDIEIKRFVTEYQAQVLEDDDGNRYVAPFPSGVVNPTQYGSGVKAHSVYMSVFQLIPYDRVSSYFKDQMGLPLSSSSVYNFNRDAYKRLEVFDDWLVNKLTKEQLLHADETGVNIGGKRHWLHTLATEELAYFYAHEKRGTEAMEEMRVLPNFKGILCHDHWKPYYTYEDCTHSLCNAHHLRELTRAWEQDAQKWANKMHKFLEELNIIVKNAGGSLSEDNAKQYRAEYQTILLAGEVECPAADESQRKKGQRGRLKQSKARNFLNRLRDFENDVLLFMVDEQVPFTNNLGENAIRMTKVQQKISGCFRSMNGAEMFCRVRSFILTCQKQGVNVSGALRQLFAGKLPDFVQQNE